MEEVLVLAIRLLEDNRLLTLQADLSQPIPTHKQILTSSLFGLCTQR